MSKKLEIYILTQELFKNKEEMLKHPDAFREILEGLRKAVIDDVPDDEEPQEEGYGDGYSIMDDDAGNHPSDEEEGGDDADKWLKEQGAKKTEKFFNESVVDQARKAKSLDEAKAIAHAAVRMQPGAREHNIKNAINAIESSSSPENLASTMQQFSGGYDEKGSSKKFMRDWEPQSEYSPEHDAAIKQHMANGYTHREAERLAGAHKGGSDWMAAMKSGIAPSMMSDKMMGDLKPLAKQWLEEADRKEKMSANPEVNPMKHAAGKMMEAHEKGTAAYAKAHNEFLASDAVKGLKGKDRHQAIQAWKAEYKAKNPDHEGGLAGASEAQKTYGSSKEAAKQSLKEKMDHIMSGGQSMPADMSTAEAMQHLGGGKTEEGYQGSITQDPTAGFVARNPKLLAALKPEQQERLTRVDSAAKAQGKIRIRKGGQQ